MNKPVTILCGAGQIGTAITRRVAAGTIIVIGDKFIENAARAADLFTKAGFEARAFEMDLSDVESIQNLVKEAAALGPVKYLINAAGVSPSQATIEEIIEADLVGTAALLEEVGKVICEGGSGVTISSQSGFRMKALTAQEDRALAMTPVDQLKDLEILQERNINDTLHAYQIAKRANEKRVMYEAVRWGERGARINCIAPGIVVTPLALDEFNGIRGNFYKNMFAKSPAGRPGTADEIAEAAQLFLSEQAKFITGATLLIDGGATASYYYGPLQPELNGS